MEDRLRELDVPEVARTIVWYLVTRRAPRTAVDGAKLGVVQALLAWRMPLLVHRLRVLNVADGHVLDLLWGEEAELDLLHRLERRAGVGEHIVPAVHVVAHRGPEIALPLSDVGMLCGPFAFHSWRSDVADAQCFARPRCFTFRSPPSHCPFTTARPLRGPPPPPQTPSLPLLRALVHR